MTRRPVHFHLGLDQAGDRCLRMRGAAELRRCRERQRLRPKLVTIVTCGTGQAVWRNGMHRRRWLLLTEQARGDRRCFLMTLRRPPLVSPVRPF
jgi:hypothetical protein